MEPAVCRAVGTQVVDVGFPMFELVLDFNIYRQEMASYYHRVSASAYRFNAPEFARQYDAVYRTAGSWLRDLAMELQEVGRGKRVLEVACGHGRGTRYLAESANYEM